MIPVNDSPSTAGAVLIDAQPICLMGLEEVIRKAKLEVLGRASTCEAAHRVVTAIRPSLLIIDPLLPDGDGLDLLRRWKSERILPASIVFTVRTHGRDINTALSLGAHAFVFKDASMSDLSTAIDVVARGGKFTPAEVTKKAEESSSQTQLTSREAEVLGWVMKGYKYREIAEQLGVQTETIRSHTKNLMGKFGVKSRLQMVASAIRLGLVRSDLT